MSKIMSIINGAKEFSRTPAGQIAVSGIGYMATMAVCGGIVAKFLPGKATFGRALGMGLYAVGMQTIVGAGIATEQQQELEFAKESFKTYHNEMQEKIRGLRSEKYQLEDQLSEKEKELENKTKEMHRLRVSTEADMAGTMRHIEELQANLDKQEEELYYLRDENADLRVVVEKLKKQRDGVMHPRPRKDEIPLGCPAVEDLLGF